jgi:hypothetical protein
MAAVARTPAGVVKELFIHSGDPLPVTDWPKMADYQVVPGQPTMNFPPISRETNPWILADQREVWKNLATALIFGGAFLSGVVGLLAVLVGMF